MEGKVLTIISILFLHVISGAANNLSFPVYLNNCSDFGQYQRALTLKENITSGSLLFNVDKVSKLSFNSGNDDGAFKIEKASTNWTIRTNGSLDYETKPMYFLGILCSDKSNQTVAYFLRVIVKDVVEGNFTLDYETLNNFTLETMGISAATVTVPEDTKINTEILELNAASANKENLDLYWNITGNCVLDVNLGKTPKEFSKNKLVLRRNVLYDEKKNNTYVCSVFVYVESHQEFNRTLKVTVKIQDVDNKNPKFERIHYKAEILENATQHQEVIRISAFDQDYGINQKILYEIVDPLNSTFAITDKTNTPANISVAGKLDREKQSVITLVVKVRYLL